MKKIECPDCYREYERSDLDLKPYSCKQGPYWKKALLGHCSKCEGWIWVDPTPDELANLEFPKLEVKVIEKKR